jgi:hypothetical protein
MTIGNLTYFYMFECYQTSHMSCNKCNSPCMKSFTYAICVTRLQLCRNNYHAISLQLQLWYHVDTSFHQSIKIQHMALWKFLVENYFLFEILISTIHYDCSFYMVFYYDMWHSKNLPHDILIEFWRIKIKIKINLSS